MDGLSLSFWNQTNMATQMHEEWVNKYTHPSNEM